MIKIRIEGIPSEVEAFIAELNRYANVLQQSAPYPNRRSQYVRVYCDLGDAVHSDCVYCRPNGTCCSDAAADEKITCWHTADPYLCDYFQPTEAALKAGTPLRKVLEELEKTEVLIVRKRGV